jgi:pseudouridine synthase
VDPDVAGEAISLSNMKFFNSIRLQKYLSQQGICSRRQAEDCIRSRKVLVNQKIASLGDKVDGTEEILFDGKKIPHRQKKTKVLIFYKPKGVECTLNSNRGGKTLRDFDFGADRVFPVGRLDKDSHGLLFLTNDGDLANILAHPRFEHEKEYLVVVRGCITPQILQKLSNGIDIEGKKTAPCIVEQEKNEVLRFVLREGRNRQIRRMCELVGLEVKDLLRVRIENIWLNTLKEGRWRKANEMELSLLKKNKNKLQLF